MQTNLIKNPVHLSESGLIANWVKRADNSPMRPIATGRRHRVVGSDSSIKNGCALSQEPRNELHALQHAEVRTDVVSYLAQPDTWGTKVNATSNQTELNTQDAVVAHDWHREPVANLTCKQRTRQPLSRHRGFDRPRPNPRGPSGVSDLGRRYADMESTGQRVVTSEVLIRSDLGPMRLRTNGRRKKPSGLYYSVKSGRHFPWESRPELHDLHRAEVRTDVLSSMVQPHTLKLCVDGRYQQYTPDRQDFLTNGRTEIVEVKGDLKSLEPDYVEKLELARLVYEGLGYSFRVIERTEIEAEPAFSAISLIQSYRRTSITNADVLIVREHMSGGGERELAEIQLLFGPGPSGLAKVCALMVRRVVAINIEQGLSPSSAVSLVRAS